MMATKMNMLVNGLTTSTAGGVTAIITNRARGQIGTAFAVCQRLERRADFGQIRQRQKTDKKMAKTPLCNRKRISTAHAAG